MPLQVQRSIRFCNFNYLKKTITAAHSKSRSDDHTDFSAVFRCFIGVYAEARVVGFRRLQRNEPVLLRDVNADVLCQLVIAVLGADTGGTVKC